MEKDKVYISGAIAHYNIDERKGAFANAELDQPGKEEPADGRRCDPFALYLRHEDPGGRL